PVRALSLFPYTTLFRSEYLESRRDGWRYYYDVNALSNFVADPVRVIGFDPTERLVDALVARAIGAGRVTPHGAARTGRARRIARSEEHTSELQSRSEPV